MIGRHDPVQPGGERAAPSEVDVATTEGDGLDGGDGQGGQGAQRDQGVHVGRAVAGQSGRVAEEGPAAADLHGHGQEQYVQPAVDVSGATVATGQGGQGQRPRDGQPEHPVVGVRLRLGRSVDRPPVPPSSRRR